MGMDLTLMEDQEIESEEKTGEGGVSGKEWRTSSREDDMGRWT